MASFGHSPREPNHASGSDALITVSRVASLAMACRLQRPQPRVPHIGVYPTVCQHRRLSPTNSFFVIGTTSLTLSTVLSLTSRRKGFSPRRPERARTPGRGLNPAGSSMLRPRGTSTGVPATGDFTPSASPASIPQRLSSHPIHTRHPRSARDPHLLRPTTPSIASIRTADVIGRVPWNASAGVTFWRSEF